VRPSPPPRRPSSPRCDQLGQRVDAERRIDCEEHRVLRGEAEHDEVARHLHRQVGRDAGQGDEARERRHVQRVAVRDRLHEGARPDAAAATRAVDRDDLLLPDPAEAFGEEARDDGRRAACRRVADDGHWLGRIVLRLRYACGGGEGEAERRQCKSISTGHAWVLRREAGTISRPRGNMNDEGLACGIIAGDAVYPASPGAAAWIASACTPPASPCAKVWLIRRWRSIRLFPRKASDTI